MCRAAYIAAALCILACPALAQFAPQEWTAPQDGMNLECRNVGYFQGNNLAGPGNRCLEADSDGKVVVAGSGTACGSGAGFTVGDGSQQIPPGQTGLDLVSGVLSSQAFQIDCGPPLGGTSDDMPAICAALTTSCPTGHCIAKLRPSTYRIKSICGVGTTGPVTTGVQLEGYGPGATTLLIDDSGGNIGDVLTFTNTLDSAVRMLSFNTTTGTPRTAGSYVTVAGGDPSIILPGFAIQATFFHFDDVNVYNWFNGVVVKDSSTTNGARGVYIRRGFWNGAASGGRGILLSSLSETAGYPNGASFFLSDLWMQGTSTSTPPSNSIAVEVTGTCDWTSSNIETWGFTHGGEMDPPTGTRVLSTHMVGDFWDFSSSDSFLMTSVGGGEIRWVDVDTTWFAGGNVGLNASGVNELNVSGASRSFGNATWGFLISASNPVNISSTENTNNCAGDIKITGSSDRFTLTGNHCHSNGSICAVPVVDVPIEADVGSSHGTIVGNECTNSNGSILDNTGSSQVIVNENDCSLSIGGVPYVQDPNQAAAYWVSSSNNQTTNSVDIGALTCSTATCELLTAVSAGYAAPIAVVPFQFEIENGDLSPGYANAKLGATYPLQAATSSAGPPLTNLAAWYRADHCTVSGGHVTACADMSGNGNTLTTAVGSPVFIASSINGKNGIRFSGGTQYLAGASNVVSAGATRYISAVVAPTAATGAFTVGGPIYQFNSTAPSLGGYVGITGGLTYGYSSTATSNAISSPPPILGRAVAFEMGTTAGSVPTYAINGTTYGASATTVLSDTGTAGFSIGGLQTSAESFFGDIDEVLVYSGTPSGTDLGNLRYYEEVEYDIAMAGATGVLTYSCVDCVVGGGTGTTPQNLGTLIPNGDLVSCATSGSVCTPTPVSPSTFQPAGTYLTSIGVSDPVTTTGGATPTIGSKFDNVSITLNGGGGIQTAAQTGDVTKPAGSNATTLKNTGTGAGSCIGCSVAYDAQGRETTYSSVSYVPIAHDGKVWTDATDAAANAPHYLYPGLTSFSNTISFAPTGTGDSQVTIDVVAAPNKTLSYYAVGITPAIISGRLATSMTTVAAGTVEYPLGVTAKSWTLAANVLSNTLSAGTTTFFLSYNGTVIGGPAYAAGVTGVVSSGPTAITSTASGDTWGVFVSGTGAPTGAMTAAVTLTVNY